MNRFFDFHRSPLSEAFNRAASRASRINSPPESECPAFSTPRMRAANRFDSLQCLRRVTDRQANQTFTPFARPGGFR
jgi:hypothetical protein